MHKAKKQRNKQNHQRNRYLVKNELTHKLHRETALWRKKYQLKDFLMTATGFAPSVNFKTRVPHTELSVAINSSFMKKNLKDFHYGATKGKKKGYETVVERRDSTI